MNRVRESLSGVRAVVLVVVIAVAVVLVAETWPSPQNLHLAQRQQLPTGGPSLVGDFGDCLRLDHRTSLLGWAQIGWASSQEAIEGIWWDTDPQPEVETFCTLSKCLGCTLELPRLDPGKYRVCYHQGDGACTEVSVEGN